MHSIWRVCSLVALAASAADSPRLYLVTVETVMPHLEENLRYSTERSRQCLAREDLDSAFPVLHHPSLAGCGLQEQRSDGDLLYYVLVCENSSGTTGSATWRLGENGFHGTLHVKLGGKNMTFSQRATATLLGDCPST